MYLYFIRSLNWLFFWLLEIVFDAQNFTEQRASDKRWTNVVSCFSKCSNRQRIRTLTFTKKYRRKRKWLWIANFSTWRPTAKNTGNGSDDDDDDAEDDYYYLIFVVGTIYFVWHNKHELHECVSRTCVECDVVVIVVNATAKEIENIFTYMNCVWLWCESLCIVYRWMAPNTDTQADFISDVSARVSVCV